MVAPRSINRNAERIIARTRQSWGLSIREITDATLLEMSLVTLRISYYEGTEVSLRAEEFAKQERFKRRKKVMVWL